MSSAALLILVASLALGCRRSPEALTLVAAILPGELPAYRALVGEFERASGRRVVVVPQQYADIRRALAAESAAGSGTIDLVELDVYSLASAAQTSRSSIGRRSTSCSRRSNPRRFAPERSTASASCRTA